LQSALELAARNGHIGCVVALMDAGADANRVSCLPSGLHQQLAPARVAKPAIDEPTTCRAADDLRYIGAPSADKRQPK